VPVRHHEAVVKIARNPLALFHGQSITLLRPPPHGIGETLPL
jgi:hypothetical protein